MNYSECRKHFLAWRRIDGTPCPACGGRGVQTYSSTSTWRHTAGGQLLTRDVCSACWGSGDADQPGANLQKFEREMKDLKQEVAELLVDCFCEIAHLVTDGPHAGWWDSQGRGSACLAGDRLVELGLWERHPDGVGSRWFYRPK